MKLSSVTYFGFADFTTTVGETIVVFKPSTTAIREIEPTLVEQIRPTTMFFPDIISVSAVEKGPKIIEDKKDKVKEEIKKEKQNALATEVKEGKTKTAKALFQEEKKEEKIATTTEASYEDEEEDEDDEESEEDEDHHTEEPGIFCNK